MTESVQDRIEARIARVTNARDQVVGTLIADLKASIAGATAGGQAANPLECRAVAVLERLIAPGGVMFDKPAAMGKTTDVAAQLATAVDPEAPVTLDDPRFAAHPISQANADSWPRSKRRRRPTRAEKIAAGKGV